MPRVPEVETERLTLRDWTPEAVDEYARICADPEVMRFMEPPRPATRAEAAFSARSLQLQWSQYGFGHWAVHLTESGRFIGRAGIKRHDTWGLDPQNTEIGWMLDRSVWGRGYATEAAVAARDFAFEEVGSPEVISITRPGNAASRRVMEKAGLAYVGTHVWMPKGIEVVWYALRSDGAPPTGATQL